MKDKGTRFVVIFMLAGWDGGVIEHHDFIPESRVWPRQRPLQPEGEVMRIPARHVAQDALHLPILAGLAVFHFQLYHILGVRRQLDSQVLQVEEDRVVQQAGDDRRADARDLVRLVAVATIALSLLTHKTFTIYNCDY